MSDRGSFRLCLGVILVLLGGLTGCSVDSAKNHYVLAEKMWTDRKYLAALAEFEKVIAKDPKSKLGLQAAYRAAMTQYLFLSQYGDAVRNFQLYIQGETDPHGIWDAELQIGEILFSKTEQYDRAIQHYQAMLKKDPRAPDNPEILFRIGKSQFFLFQFIDAVKTFQELVKRYPNSPWAEKATFEIGATYFTQGEQHSDIPSKNNSEDEPYQVAMNAYTRFIKRYPNSDLVPEAKFGIASCLEELDQLDDAYSGYLALKDRYPSPHVIDVKLIRIRERLAQRHK